MVSEGRLTPHSIASNGLRHHATKTQPPPEPYPKKKKTAATAGLDLGLAVMRGERPRPPSYMAYWLLAAVYAFGMLGAAVAAGSPEAGMLQDVALCIPLVTAAVPLGVGVAAGAATEAAATRLSEHVVPSEEAVAASVEAWCDVFMRDFQEQHCVVLLIA